MCQYPGCNIDPTIAQGYPQYPDLCYFHQVRKFFDRFTELLKEHCYIQDKDGSYEFKGQQGSNSPISPELMIVEQTLKNEFPEFLDFLSIETFVRHLYKVLGNEDVTLKINTSDFYFPVRIENKQLLLEFSYINGTQLPQWSNSIELYFDSRDTKFYDVGFIKNIFTPSKRLEYNVISSMFFHDSPYIYSNSNSGITNPQVVLGMQNIRIYKDLIIHSIDCIQSVDISNCKFLGDVLEISAPKLTSYHNEINSKKVSFKVPFRQVKLVNSIGTPLFTPDAQIDFYDGVYEYDDNNTQEDMAIYDSSSPYDMLGSNNKAPKLIIPGSSLSQNIRRGIIQNANLHKARFLPAVIMGGKHDISGENITKLNFINCKFDKGHKLYEELNFKNYPKDQQAAILKRLESSYRYLRKYYDEKGDYIEGNDFHFNYMEAKRKNSNIWDKLWLYPYGCLNGYNTKPSRTVIALLALILIATFINVCYGSFAIKDIYDSGINTNKHDLYASWLYSSANIIPLINKDIVSSQGTITLQVTMIENLFGTIFIALLLMALRNRFRRSKTPEEIKEG